MEAETPTDGRRLGRPRASTIALGVAVVASAILIACLQSGMTFLNDDWTFLFFRGGFNAHAFLDPHGEHIVVAPVTIYKALQATFGMDSARPFQIVGLGLFLLSVVVLFVWLRERVGEWGALIGACLILFLGSSWTDLLWSFQMVFSGSLAAGIGALIALDRGDRKGDRIACVLLVASLAFSTLGLSFIAAAVVELALGKRGRANRAFIPLVPIVLYGLWYLGWGHTAPSYISVDNALHTPRYVWNAASMVMASLTGLSSGHDETRLQGVNWGHAILLIALVATAIHFYRRRHVPPQLLVVAAAGLSFWILAGLNFQIFRDPLNVRYQYPGAVFVLLMAGEVLRGVRVPRLAGLAVVAVALFSIVSNLMLLVDGANDDFRPASRLVKAQLGAVAIARPFINPEFIINIDQIGFVTVNAETYFGVTDKHGTPAFSVSEIEGTTAPARITADKTLGGAENLLPAPARADLKGAGSTCATLRPSGVPSVDVGPGKVTLRPVGGAAKAGMGRFANGLPYRLKELPVGEVGLLDIPADHVGVPWRLGVIGGGPLRVCGALGG